MALEDRRRPAGFVEGGPRRLGLERSLSGAAHSTPWPCRRRLGHLRHLGLERFLATRDSLERRLVVALIVARILEPRSKLATVRGWDPQELGGALTGGGPPRRSVRRHWLGARQQKIENRLASERLQDGCLVLYDVTSTYFEGETCPLAKRGYSRDRKRGNCRSSSACCVTVRGAPSPRRQPSGPHDRVKSAPLSLRAALGGRGGRSGDGSPAASRCPGSRRSALDPLWPVRCSCPSLTTVTDSEPRLPRGAASSASILCWRTNELGPAGAVGGDRG